MDDGDFMKIGNQMMSYDLPCKVHVTTMKGGMKFRKPSFYMVNVSDLLRYCQGNYVFKKFNSIILKKEN